MIILIDVGKAFGRIEGNFLNLIMRIYEEAAANSIVDGERLKTFPQDQERFKGIHSRHFYSALYQKSQPGQFGKKRK